jgi:hypothetical protein
MFKRLALVAALALTPSCKPGGVAGVASDYADAVCACKDASCLKDVTEKFAAKLGELRDVKDQAEAEAAAKEAARGAECAKKIMLSSLGK